jgi:hypothetical protein
MGAHDIVSLLEPDGPRQFLLERLGAWRGTVVVSSTAHPVVAAAPRPVPDHPGRLTTRRLQSHDSAPTHLRGLRGASYAFLTAGLSYTAMPLDNSNGVGLVGP